MMLDLSTLKVGSPVTWRTTVYGDVAVHIDGFSPNGQVAILRIVGGEDSTPANRFPELSDGIGFATAEQLVKRTRQASARKLTWPVETVEKGIPPRKRRAPAKLSRQDEVTTIASYQRELNANESREETF